MLAELDGSDDRAAAGLAYQRAADSEAAAQRAPKRSALAFDEDAPCGPVFATCLRVPH